MRGKPNWFALIVLYIVLCLLSAVLAYLLAAEIYDPRFFTYFNYFFGWLFYNLLFISAFVPVLWEVVCLLVLPVYFNTVNFVFFAIIIIVKLNDWVWVRDTIFGGTSLTIGDIHTGDFLVHDLPAYTFLAIFLIHIFEYVTTFRLFWKPASFWYKLVYVLYVFLAPLAVLILYMLTMPFGNNYPTGLSTPAVTSLVIALSVFFTIIFLAGTISVIDNPYIVGTHVQTTAGFKVKIHH